MRLLQVLFAIVAVGAVYPAAAQEKRAEKRADLIARMNRGEPKAVLELGELRDESIIPLLRKQLKKGTTDFGGVGSNAQMALARLGEKKQLDEILAECDSDDPIVQDHAIAKLEYVGGRQAIRKLGMLLADNRWRSMKESDSDKRGPNGERPQGDVMFLPRSQLAVMALSRMISDPPTKPRKGKRPNKKEMKSWHKWWKKNHKKYE